MVNGLTSLMGSYFCVFKKRKYKYIMIKDGETALTAQMSNLLSYLIINFIEENTLNGLKHKTSPHKSFWSLG